jgi:hypothetical protein
MTKQHTEVCGASRPVLVALLVGAHDDVAALRVDEVREGETHAQLRREQAAVVGRAEQPEFGRDAGSNPAFGLDADLFERVVVWQGAVEVADQLPDLFREVFGRG